MNFMNTKETHRLVKAVGILKTTFAHPRCGICGGGICALKANLFSSVPALSEEGQTQDYDPQLKYRNALQGEGVVG